MSFDKKKIKDINTHGLTLKNISKLIPNRSLIGKETGFWRNNGINAWCISGSCGVDKYPVCDADEYWLGVYDNEKRKVSCYFSAYSGMCSYTFDKFFNPAEIETEDDYKIQYMFIERMNKLIEQGVFTCPWENETQKSPAQHRLSKRSLL